MIAAAGSRDTTMVAFERASSSRLYVSNANLAGAGWWAYLVSPEAKPPSGPVTLKQALEDLTLNGSFVYAPTAPLLDSGDRIDAFIAKIDAIVGATVSKRAVLWLPSSRTDSISPDTARVQSLITIAGQIRTNNGFGVLLTGVPGVNASVNPGATVTFEGGGDALLYSGGGVPAVTLDGPQAPNVIQNDSAARLWFAGPRLGCFTFAVSIQRRSLFTKLAWGFQLLVPSDLGPPSVRAGASAKSALVLPYLSAWLPLADGDSPGPTEFIGFSIQVNLVNPNNLLPASRTVFFFTGKDDTGSETQLVSFYRTAFGKGVSLYPAGAGVAGTLQAGLVPNAGFGSTPLYNGFSFSPVGDFFLGVDAPDTADPALLLCGLSGSETIAFLPRTAVRPVGSRLRFCENQAAYSPQFPLEESSPVGPPIDAAASLMAKDFLTAWGNVLGAPASLEKAHYTAAPKGADPFGKGASSVAGPGGACPVLVPRDPGVALPDNDLCFPLFPLTGFVPGTGEQDLTADELERLDRQIVSPTRRSQITKAAPARSPSAAFSLGLARSLEADAPFNTATPAGLIALVDGGAWSRLLLAQVKDGETVKRQLGFTSLVPDLQAAFQTDNLLLVVANGKHLGTPKDGVMPAAPAPGADPAFYDTINVDDWVFGARVGHGSAYGDYHNVMIVKGVKGKLTDLATSPEKWTQKDVFAAPSVKNADGTTSEPDVSQLIPLSAWLSSYFAAALSRKDSPYFQDFCRIIEDESWQGVLFLRVDLEGIPKDLLGILSGVSDLSSLYAHHIGAGISQIDCATVQQKDSSSLFGLVYYVDPGYDDKLPPHAITPSDMTATYELTVLTLKALFRNTAVQKFESVAQVVLNELYGSRVSKMGTGGNDFNAVVLEGAYQMNGSAPVYALSARQPGTFFLSNNVLLSVDVDTANMATRDDGATSGQVVSWISMSGKMTFTIVEAEGLPDFDIYSFGAASGEGGTGQGLSFGALGLRIAYPVANPQATALTLEEREMFFDVSNSQARPKSLYKNLQLELIGLLSGGEKSAPGSLGFMTVATPYGLQGVQARRWHGLSFRVNMGTPGALASKINLSSTLLLAWADDSGAPDRGAELAAMVGLELPGTGPAGELFSLQTVLKVSVGVVRLLYNEEKSSFLLLMNEIALKFLGLLKIPPNGATSFFLFGNPEATDPTGLGWYAIYNQDVPKPQKSA